jgi:hypothetical protein
VKAQAARVKDTFTDGINVDIEDALKADQTQDKRLLTVLMHELKGELDREVCLSRSRAAQCAFTNN